MASTQTARDLLLNYWSKYADKPTIQSMMLNDHADLVDASDRADVMAGLPAGLSKMQVLEIGAGIGRFTKLLAEKCHHVIATDFIASFIEKNQELHSSYKNVSFEVGDAVHMKQDEESQDLIFTNWLLMYLTDEEMIAFFTNVLRCLRPGGFMHLRESCTESSTRTKSKGTGSGNPTHYRHVSLYIEACRMMRFVDANGDVWTLEPQWSRSIETYVQVKQNWRQCQIIFRKVKSSVDDALPTTDDLVACLSAFNVRQAAWDEHLMVAAQAVTTEEETDANQLIAGSFASVSNPCVLNLRPGAVNPFKLSQESDFYVTAIETDPFAYSGHLNVANAVLNPNVRCHWVNPACASAKLPDAFFDCVIAAPDQLNCPVFEAVKHALKQNAQAVVKREDGSIVLEEIHGYRIEKTVIAEKLDDSFDEKWSALESM